MKNIHFMIYDTNLSYRLEIGTHYHFAVLDWWYDRGMRRHWYMPFEVVFYNIPKR